ncbi:hypothetical protein BDR26DRAFT_797144 [Obelidium mucronatum]|nr:hypothetical protein BDR26DRAFT_797144 [Obelidium mucronatum]
MLPVIAIGLILVTHVFAYDFSWGPAPGAAVVGVPEWTKYFQAVNGKATPKKDVRSCRPGGHTDVWGASFDDGPGVETLSVIEYFKNINMLATFWVIGVNIPRLPDTLAATYQAGHEIGTHTWSHKDLTTLSDDQIVAELVYGSRAIYEVIGVFPKYYRPPYGAIDERVRKIGAMLGLRAVRWNFDSDDWQHKDKNMTTVPTLFRDWMEQEMDQGISLQHDYYA